MTLKNLTLLCVATLSSYGLQADDDNSIWATIKNYTPLKVEYKITTERSHAPWKGTLEGGQMFSTKIWEDGVGFKTVSIKFYNADGELVDEFEKAQGNTDLIYTLKVDEQGDPVVRTSVGDPR